MQCRNARYIHAVGADDVRTEMIRWVCWLMMKEKKKMHTLENYYSTPVGERSIAISLSCQSVRLSVCPRVYLRNRWTGLHEICCTDPLWPWLGPPLAALRSLQFYG